ncbi:MAG: hypothetical protein M0Z99_16035 [Betaproteobacteria bacterium]|nr:hypothetical protein [Betaproteobacteria bacterium]
MNLQLFSHAGGFLGQCQVQQAIGIRGFCCLLLDFQRQLDGAAEFAVAAFTPPFSGFGGYFFPLGFSIDGDLTPSSS